MNSTESSFPTQSSLLLPYHQQAYLFNSRQDLDLLALSQTDLANQLKSYSSIHNPHPYLTMNSLAQKDSPEKSLISHTARSIPNAQMNPFLGMSHPSAHDPFSNRLQPSPIPNSLAKKLEDPMSVAAKLNFDTRIPYAPNNQLNPLAQLLEANDLKVQAQKNMQELLFYQMQNSAQLQNAGGLGYSVLMNSQNSLNYGGLLQNQAFYGGQIPSNMEILSKKQVESQKVLYSQMGLSGLEGIVGQESENLLRNAKMTGKPIEELSLMSNEQIAPYYNPKQVVRQEQVVSQVKMQSSVGKAKQVPQEIVIQDVDTPPQKECKEVQQTMTVEASNAMEELSTVSCVESQGEAKKKEKEKEKEKEKRKCFNRLCLTDSANDSLWSTQKVKNSTVCKVCCDAFNKGQYCHYCQQIYLDDETSASSDDKDWIECESCKTWNHIECETINGLKTLRVLLEKNSSYKYYCPTCRPAKSFKIPAKSAKKTVSQSKSDSPLNLTETDLQKTPVHHPKPSLDDSLISEEGLKEPTIRKFKLQDGLRSETVVKQTEVVVENVKEDLTRKKLDHVFNKHQINKKRLQGRMINNMNTVPENFSSMDKLMTQYGKRLQLSDGEIKNDLDLFRELSMQTEQQLKERRGVASRREEEMSATSSVGEFGMREPVNSGFKRSLNSNKVGKKGQRGNKVLADDVDALERDSENEGFSAGRALRNRRRNE